MKPFQVLQMRNPVAGGGGGLSNRWRVNASAVFASGNNVSIRELEMRASAGGSDLCSGGTASASSTSGTDTPDKAFDNDTTTPTNRWQSSATVPQSLEYQFSSPITVEQLALTQYNDVDTPTAFTVQYYDGSAWQTYWSEGVAATLSVATGSPQLLFTNHGDGSGGYTYWRLNITASRSGTGWPSITELELRATAGGADLTAANSADGGQAFTDNGVIGGPFLAFDGNTGTRWQPNSAPSVGSPHYIGYRLPTPKTITQISLRNYTSLGDSPKTFDVQYYDPVTSSWVTSWSVADSGFTTTNETRLFTKP